MNNKKIWAIGLLFFIYMAEIGRYTNTGDEYLIQNSNSLAAINVLITSFCLMIVPFTIRIYKNKDLKPKEGKDLCKWNSIIAFLISIFLTLTINVSIVGGLGAILYYFINKWLFVKEKK